MLDRHEVVCASDFLGISIIIYIPLIFKLGFTRLSDLYQYCVPYRHTIKDPAGNNFLLLPRGKRGLVRRLKLAINTKQHTRTKTLTKNKYPNIHYDISLISDIFYKISIDI